MWMTSFDSLYKSSTLESTSQHTLNILLCLNNRMAPTIVLITGANRGIGKGILQLYLQKPNHTIIAANRDPSHPTSQALSSIPTAKGTNLQVIKNDLTVAGDAIAAANKLASIGITHLDLVIANAGLGRVFPTLTEVTTEQVQEHVQTNIYGFLRMYQAFMPMLKASADPRWVTIGSSAAFLTVRLLSPHSSLVFVMNGHADELWL
jgi:NAD(P)-dependent dehydrogenase (short-subunit alcohol dehydrogenase family)